MGCCLIVGGDNTGSAKKIIEEKFGLGKLIHWDGRRSRPPTSIPKEVVLVIVITGFVSHALARAIKTLARKNNVPVIYVKRGLAGIKPAV
ncbi:MAG: DUF2325 domain-containing protein [Pelotomaculum sp.]|nr:DUF2325 domain-containing protein [Pelotomaculum sp.]